MRLATIRVTDDDITGPDALATAIGRHVPLGFEIAHVQDPDTNEIAYAAGRWFRSVELPGEALDLCTAIAAWKSRQGPAPKPKPVVFHLPVPTLADLIGAIAA